ncbi:hypothetical protein RB3744 [Rhodopirellula baltica SH 1]|uniref:Uncharacterized protein n=1 Tax=Rhodopirellula baltica (strain DSM 10527 / NCIMB 13988 / SH1) TaxID=243090 RepID=Q7UTQ4_RHOBA|nr:hypothetical protein RB3744 [Rhodopirellula baltica SH 1]
METSLRAEASMQRIVVSTFATLFFIERVVGWTSCTLPFERFGMSVDESIVRPNDCSQRKPARLRCATLRGEARKKAPDRCSLSRQRLRNRNTCSSGT